MWLAFICDRSGSNGCEQDVSRIDHRATTLITDRNYISDDLKRIWPFFPIVAIYVNYLCREYSFLMILLITHTRGF